MEGSAESNYAVANLKGKIFFVPLVDATLSKEGEAADAKKTGDALGAMMMSGDYVGDGTSSPRTVATNGTGGLLVVQCSAYVSLVTPNGALVVKLSDGTISWMDKVSYVKGNLDIETDSEAFNANSTTYYYQVI